MKALAILAAVAALCGLMSAPASAIPMRNLVAAASDLALGESVLYGHRRHRPRYSRPVYYGYREPYGYPTTYFGYGVGYDYGPVPFGYRLVPGLYFRR